MAKEKRRHPRLPCTGAAEVFFKPGDAPRLAKVSNLSVEGCLVNLEIPKWVIPGTVLELAFQVNKLPFRVRGQVRSVHSETSFGLHLDRLSKRGRLGLEDIIEELTANEAKNKINRERSEMHKRRRIDKDP